MVKRIVALYLALLVSNISFAEEDKVWAVASDTVKVSEDELYAITKAFMLTGQIPPSKLSAAYVEKAARDFVLYKVLAAQGYELGLDKSPEVKKILEINEQHIVGTAYLLDYLDKQKQPDFESIALEAYTLNKEQFMQEEAVNAQHILITFEGDEKKALQLASDVRKAALKGEQDFNTLAIKYSQDPSVKRNSGNLGFFDKRKMVPEFSDAAFSLKVGEVSQPVKSQYGWHIIKVLDKRPAKVLEYSEVKEMLISKAKNDYREQERSSKLADTLDKSNLKIDQDLINKVTDNLLKSQ